MDISNFLTQQAQTGTGKPAASGSALGGKTGLFALPPGASFLDLLFKTPGTATESNDSGALLSGLTPQAGSENKPLAQDNILEHILAKLGDNVPADVKDTLLNAFDKQTPDNATLPELVREIQTLIQSGELQTPEPESPDAEELASALKESIAAYVAENPDSKLADLAAKIEQTPRYEAAMNVLARLQINAAAQEETPPANNTLEDMIGDDITVTLDNDAGEDGKEASAPFSASAGRKKFIALLEHLMQGLPQENRPQVVDLPAGLLHKAMGDLEFNPGGTDTENPALIATELTPEKLEEFMNKIRQESENGQALIIGLVKILPPESEKAVIFKPRAIILPPAENSGKTNKNNETGQNIVSRLNALIAGKTKQDSGGGTQRFDVGLHALGQNSGRASQSPAPFSQNAIPQFDNSGKADLSHALQNQGGQNTPVKNDNAGIPKGPDTNVIQANGQNLPGTLTFEGLLETIFPESLPWANSGSAAGQSMSFNSPAQMASMLGQNTHAGQPHPATQMVASTIARATTNGENRNIQIKLNPPELGRVEIRMEFKKDNSGLKTQIIVEKPETYMMLQRDSHMLERALSQTGIDADGSALSMELAQDGSLFDHDDRGGSGGERNKGGDDSQSAGDNDDIEIIETTVDWYIDPDTGLTRYDMLV